MNPFTRPTAAWHRVGLASEFPSIDDDARIVPRCKAFDIPKTNGPMEEVEDIDLPGELKDQVLVFKYKGKYHAIDHVSYLLLVKNTKLILSSNAPIHHSRFRGATSLTLKTLALCSARVSLVPSMVGRLIYSLAAPIVATTNSKCGKCNCATHLGVRTKKFG
jgi:hypothetical protein